MRDFLRGKEMKKLILLFIILFCSSICFSKTYEIPESWKKDHFLRLTRQDLDLELEENYIRNRLSINIMEQSHRHIMHSLERGHWRKMTMSRRRYGRRRYYRYRGCSLNEYARMRGIR
ncbi:hypothetical protein LCGC14_0579800 [marine sediment metagenome]|uniref:Uncharacterized protein n=1 Tax=marine sediment metagenome TaxID=412755 RepID=A0A0F9UPZ5_9ZZZZ